MESPYFDGADERYKTVKRFKSMEEAEQFCVKDNPLLVIDKDNIRKSNDFGDYRKCALEITLVCHAGIVDLSAFKDDIFGFRKKNGHIMPYLKSIQGGMASIYPYFTNVPTAKEYWKFYPVNILFRDTMCFAPAEGKSLAILGNCVDVPKIILPEGVIGCSCDHYVRIPSVGHKQRVVSNGNIRKRLCHEAEHLRIFGNQQRQVRQNRQSRI